MRIEGRDIQTNINVFQEIRRGFRRKREITTTLHHIQRGVKYG